MTAVETALDEPRLAFCCNPYHRGGIERFMADLAVAWANTVGSAWFVLPTPRKPFRNAGTSRTVASILEKDCRASSRLHLIQPAVGPEFEFGTEAYRAAVYARALVDMVPAAVPLMTSDDPAAWRAASWLASRNPSLLVVHGDYDGYYEQLRRYVGAAAAVVAISGRIRDNVAVRCPAIEAPVELVPTGIALGARPRSRAESQCAQLIWIGRMDESSKRVSDLPRIASALRQGGVQFQLTIVGDGPSRGLLEEGIRSAGLESCARLHGWASPAEVRRLLEASDLLLLPSNREGLPVAMMEAFAAGCAVVATRVSGVEDYERSPGATNCLWVHAIGDVEAAAECVRAALLVPHAERSRRAREFAETEFGIDRCAERYRVLGRNLAQRSSPRPAFGPMRHRLIRWTSAPVAAQRRLRVWAASR